MIQVKICGLTEEEAVDAALEAGADYLGVVFFEKSPRHVSIERAAEILELVPEEVGRVGLFVDPDDALLDEKLATGALDLLQLHGAETAVRVAAIKQRTGKPVMKVIKVTTADDVERGVAAYAAVADRLMFDAAEGVLPGGNATPFDWTILSSRKISLPWMLAGGLTPDNLAEAVRVTGARTVDVSSGVESSRGVKSVELIRAFLKKAASL